MATRSEFLRLIWDDIINRSLRGERLDNVIRETARKPDGPFADVGPALQRIRAAGASDRDIGLIARLAAYEAVFGILYMLEDPGVDDGKMLFEELLTADPSGLDGRPGSAEGAV